MLSDQIFQNTEINASDFFHTQYFKQEDWLVKIGQQSDFENLTPLQSTFQ